jgi:hypothetical protein
MKCFNDIFLESDADLLPNACRYAASELNKSERSEPSINRSSASACVRRQGQDLRVPVQRADIQEVLHWPMTELHCRSQRDSKDG